MGLSAVSRVVRGPGKVQGHIQAPHFKLGSASKLGWPLSSHTHTHTLIYTQVQDRYLRNLLFGPVVYKDLRVLR
jgi:hypothetical protein